MSLKRTVSETTGRMNRHSTHVCAQPAKKQCASHALGERAYFMENNRAMPTTSSVSTSGQTSVPPTIYVVPLPDHGPKPFPQPSMWDLSDRGMLAPIIDRLNIPLSMLDECSARCFLPSLIAQCLSMGSFILQVAPTAQAAMRAFGVPASFLIAKAHYEGEGCSSENDAIYSWFMNAARRISESLRDSSVTRLSTDPVAFAKTLSKLRLYDDSDLQEILDRIKMYGLAECDEAKEPGYSRGRV